MLLRWFLHSFFSDSCFFSGWVHNTSHQISFSKFKQHVRNLLYNIIMFKQLHLKGRCTFSQQKTQCPQIYIKLNKFKDYDSRKLPLKFYQLRCCIFFFKRVKVIIFVSVLACKNVLKGRYTFGNCQRPIFSFGVSHHMHKITNLWKFGLNLSS